MPKRSEAISTTLAPPVKGWNTRDALANMDPEYAIEMVNFFPGFGSVDLRNGNTIAISSASSANYSVGTFRYSTYDFLVTGQDTNKIYSHSLSSGGSWTSTDITGAASITNVGMYFQQFRDRLFMTSDFALSDVHHWTGSGNIATSGFTGPSGDDKLLGPMCSYKNRLYFAQRAAYSVSAPRNAPPSIWYGGVDAVTGALTEFSFSSVLRIGGYISFIGSVTRAKDFSEDELFCAISSEGDVLLYQGDYPGSTTWSIVGRYTIPRPLSPKAFFYFGSTLIVMTAQGAFSINEIMGGNFGTQGSSVLAGDITNIIKSAYVEAVKTVESQTTVFKDNYDDLIWTGIHYPRGNMLILNIPLTNSSSEQYVMNTVTGAWCRFTGQDIYSMAVYKDRLYFVNPAHAKVMKADDGYVDTTPASGAAKNRTIKLRPAYTFLGNRETYKQFVEARPYIYQSEGLALTMDADLDFANVAATQTVTPDTADTSYKLYTPRVGLKGIGKAISARIDQTVTTKRMSLQATEVLWKEADIV